MTPPKVFAKPFAVPFAMPPVNPASKPPMPPDWSPLRPVFENNYKKNSTHYIQLSQTAAVSDIEMNLPPAIPCKAPFASPPTVPAAQPSGSENMNFKFAPLKNQNSKCNLKQINVKWARYPWRRLQDCPRLLQDCPDPELRHWLIRHHHHLVHSNQCFDQ